MTAIKVAILLILFIFAIFIQVWANPVKSINDAANQVTIMKMDENKVVMQKKKELTKEPTKSSKKREARFPPVMPYSDYGAIMGTAKMEVNFLKASKEKKRSQLTECLDKIIFSYDFAQNGWRSHFPSFMGVAEAKSSNPDIRQPNFGPYPPGNNYFNERRILETFKHLQFKREELSKEIFMGFRFSFNPMSGHMFFEINVTPPSEAGTGIIIPF
jgi:hypothetical protein